MSKNVTPRIWKRVVSMSLCIACCLSMTACTPKTAEQTPAPVVPSSTTTPSQEPSTFVGPEPLSSKSTQFYSDYKSLTDVYKAGLELNKEIAGEGYILLKNEQSSLPVAENATISLFGKNSVDLKEPLTKAGFTVNPVLQDFYADNERSGAGANRANDSSFNATGETPQAKYTGEVKASFAQYGGTAVVVFARNGGEGSDLPRVSFAEVAGQETASKAYPTRSDIESGTWTPVGGMGRESDPFEHYLELDDHEEALLDMLQNSDEFDNVVVLLNSTYAMELGFLRDAKYSKVKSCIWLPGTGANGLEVVGDILNGKINPSGRTPDILNADFKADPTWNNYANNFVGNEGGFDSAKGNQYTSEDGTLYKANFNTGFYEVSYEEGIYMGYHYYETRGFTDGADWYNQQVIYPFGYGLSYTDFSWELVGSIPASKAELGAEDSITVQIKVTNNGTVAGKDVVQLYYEAPHTAGGIEKAKVELIDFAKTGLLAPGASEMVSLTLDARDMASYDYSDANKNGFTGYELDGGTYKLYVSENSHSWAKNDTLSVEYTVPAAGITFATDDNSGNAIENRFDTVNGEMAGRVLSRNDWAGTWPTRPLWFDVTDATTIDPLWAAEYRAKNGGKDWTATDTAVTPVYLAQGKAELVKAKEWLDHLPMPLADTENKEGNEYTLATWYDEANPNYPDESGKPGKAPWYRDTAPTFRAESERYTALGSAPIQLSDLIGKDFDDALWDEYLDQFTVKQAVAQIITAFNFIPDKALSVPNSTHGDGPFGIQEAFDRIPYLQPGDMMRKDQLIKYTSQVVLAASFNKDLAYRYGKLNGDYGLWAKLEGWYAPGVNIHRTPFSGRNNNYYSEDGVLSGIMTAEVCKGCGEKGMVTFIKHFAINDQETNRDTNAIATWVDEQTMRQIYFKPFEMAVKDGNTLGMMTAFNRIGFDWAGASYELLTEVARQEWGFQGIYITDAAGTSQAGDYMSANQMIRAGQDQSLDGVPGGYIIDTDTGVPAFATGITSTDSANTPTHLWALRDCLKRIQYVVAHTAPMLNGRTMWPANYTKGFATFKEATAEVAVANFELSVGDQDVTLDVSDNLSAVKYLLYSGELPRGLTLDPATGKITGNVAGDTEQKDYIISVGIADEDISAGEGWTANVVRYFKITVQ